MLLPPIMNQAEELIRIGVDARQIAEMLLLLVPQSLGLTIPMALLVGVLMALGRLSGDRETVAMQACGLSLFRILTPLLVLATATAAMNCYLLLSGNGKQKRDPCGHLKRDPPVSVNSSVHDLLPWRLFRGCSDLADGLTLAVHIVTCALRSHSRARRVRLSADAPGGVRNRPP